MNDLQIFSGTRPNGDPLLVPDVLAHVTHEIRTPLNAVLGLVELTLKTGLTPEQQEYLGLMKSAGTYLLSLVNDILDFSRIEAGELALEQIRFPVRDCLAEVLRLLAFEAQEKGLRLSCQIAPEVPDELIGDPLRLRQIVVNLVGNAIKFSRRGDIVVRADLQAGDDGLARCHFSVSDQGIGIAPAQQAGLFCPYRQAEPSTARRYGGSGLGLSIAARLVELMAGKIWLDSRPGQGSTFHFTACFGLPPRPAGRTCPIPFPIPFPLPAEMNDMAAKPAPSARTLSILLVEDNPLNRRLAQLMLEKAGHRVVLAENGSAALRLLRHSRPDAILMDVEMPGADGIRTTAAIRRREILLDSRLPIIACSAHGRPEDRARCLKAGMDDYLVKPVEPAALLDALERLAQRAKPPLPPAGGQRVLDQPALLRHVGGDLHLLGEIRDLFLRDCDPLMASARQALRRRDRERFGHFVHTLHGMFRSLAAIAAREIAGTLEELAIDREPALADASFARLEHEVRLLKAALAGVMLKQPAAPESAAGVARGRSKSGRAMSGIGMDHAPAVATHARLL